MVTKVTGKNQVTVPALVARKAGIRVGSRLRWRQTDREGVLEVRVLPERGTLASSLRSAGRKYLRSNAKPIENLIREREQESAE
ncbi:MAG: AbrB/MazE/SpoVT family DNA-binding domain-containing protein [Acidobacteria bacterium]|nr:MAG: AbrB/MazE/SpoVT family DNA-binding domain-containing protein [Acidobacteriota bacterium]